MIINLLDLVIHSKGDVRVSAGLGTAATLVHHWVWICSSGLAL